MKVVITGGTGLIGTALRARLEARGDDVVVATRTPEGAGEVGWDAHAPGSLELPEDTDAVVHLAGEPIIGRRWTEGAKREIFESRATGTKVVVDAVRRHGGVRSLVSGSGVHYYGAPGEETVTEGHAAGDGFLSEVCQAWEAPAAQLERDPGVGTAVARVRTGVVLSTEGGALATMLNPFGPVRPYHWGVGGPVGSGRQWMSWVHIDDHVGAITHILDEGLEGPFNLTAPNPVRNRGFVDALGSALHRPTVLPVPKLALKMLYGESASVLFDSQRVVPERLLESGYTFRFADVEAALRDLLEEREDAEPSRPGLAAEAGSR